MTTKEAYISLSDYLYRYISRKYQEEAADIAMDAVHKQIPIVPGTDGTHRYCPTCGQYFGKQHPHCWNCGQKLDWTKDGDTNATN